MIKLKHLLPECNECGRDWNHGHDHEAGMAKNELKDMISNASKIDSMVSEGDNLPGWVSAYISLAADYMHSVAEYLGGEASRDEEPGPGYGMENVLYEGTPGAAEVEKAIEAGKVDPEEVKKAAEKAMHGDSTDLALLMVNAMAGLREAKKKPSAGLTKKEKSAVAKKAHAGKDIGKKGPGFEKVAKAAEKKYGSKEAGQKVAAAAMWKGVKARQKG